jgi:hypothetical protein
MSSVPKIQNGNTTHLLLLSHKKGRQTPHLGLLDHAIHKSLGPDKTSSVVLTFLHFYNTRQCTQSHISKYRIFPSITRTLCITRTQYFPFSRTFLIDTAHLKIHGIVRLVVARPVFRYFMPLGPRKCAPHSLFVCIRLCVSKKTQKTDKRQNIIVRL